MSPPLKNSSSPDANALFALEHRNLRRARHGLFFRCLHLLGGWLVQLETPAHSGLRCRRHPSDNRTSRVLEWVTTGLFASSCAEVAPNNVFPDLTRAR